MWFRLALAMGQPVRELQQRISSCEFAEWVAYYRVEPWGEQRADLRNALLASIIANANRSRNQAPFKIDDFLFDFSGAQKQLCKQTVEEQLAIVEMLNAAFGGEDLRNNKEQK